MEESILKCILFDQDAFREIRMMASRRRQSQWESEYLPSLSTISKGEILYTRNAAPNRLESDDVISPEDQEVLKNVWILHTELLGSSQDGLYLEKGFPILKLNDQDEVNDTDLDVLFLYSGARIIENQDESSLEGNTSIIKEKSEYPGYVRLKFASSSSSSGQQYFNNKAMKNKLFKDLHHSQFYVNANFWNMIDDSPALTGCIEDELGIYYVDYVVALYVDSWPSEAEEFLTRNRPNGWPMNEIIRQISKNGYALVATGPKEKKKDNSLWRMSFAKSERTLVHNLSDTQIRVCLFFKALAKHVLWEPECLSSYMLKNILFWSLETFSSFDCLDDNTSDNAEWSEDNTMDHLNLLIDMLCAYLDNGVIPNYFMPSQNLLAGIEKETIQMVANKAHAIQDEGLFDAILKCVAYSEFKGSCEISLNSLRVKLLTQNQTENMELLSTIYFSMYLYIRTQARRYQMNLTRGTVKQALEQGCQSLFGTMPPRAARYLVEAMFLNPEDFCLEFHDGAATVNACRIREKVVKFWRNSMYKGIFRKVVEDQEFAVRTTITVIPEFNEFLSWVDLTCAFNNQEGVIQSTSFRVNLD